MKILVFPHAMGMGGSQLNALDVAAAVRDLGHDVGVVSEDGPLVERVRALDLPHHQLVERTGARPSWRVARQLRALVKAEGYEVVHGYEWPPAVESAMGLAGLDVRVVCTVMSMSVAPFLPHSMLLIVGTKQIARGALADGFRDVSVMEPPVDTAQNAPGAVQPLDTTALGVCEDALVMVSVSRLAPTLKLEGLLSACDAIAELNRADGIHVHFVIVGDGPARDEVAAAAEQANQTLGHPVVHMIGALEDPRPAYEAGDILVGMGGSAIRCLAFAKPLIVQGERGFWQTASPGTLPRFLEEGWFGLGPAGEGREHGAVRLASEIRDLSSPSRRAELGEWGRRVAVNQFSLDQAAAMQERLYHGALQRVSGVPPTEIVRSTARATGYAQVRRVRSKLRIGRIERDDFNAVARKGVARNV